MQSTALTDEQIIAQAIAGRQSAYGMLVRKYERYVYTLALRFVKNREDADEIAQDSFLKAFRYLSDFRGECKFSTWLYKIVFSVAMNHLKKFQPDLISLDDDQKPLQIKDLGTEDASFSLELIEKKEAIHQAIAKLSPDDAGVITLFYLYEQSIEEICLVMNLTTTNAKTKLSRARQRLKQLMSENEEYTLKN
jgi:RNA polymerase sigma factor (sigma-70 family)